MDKIYIAYGSNMNQRQMKWRCPGAKYIGMATLKDYELTYRGHNHRGGVANIEAKEGNEVPVMVWSITRRDEAALDRYEGTPYLYRKESIKAYGKNGEEYEGLVYIMNDGFELADPSYAYIEIIAQGYKDGGLDPRELYATALANHKRIKN